jgi:hypothetical protein
MYVLVTMAYELAPQTEPDAAKLLRAELAGRRWLDRHEGERMPAHTVWMKRTLPPGQTTDDLQATAAQDLRTAVAAVAGMGRRIGLARVFVQVTGAGSFGVVPPPA